MAERVFDGMHVGLCPWRGCARCQFGRRDAQLPSGGLRRQEGAPHTVCTVWAVQWFQCRDVHRINARMHHARGGVVMARGRAPRTGAGCACACRVPPSRHAPAWSRGNWIGWMGRAVARLKTCLRHTRQVDGRASTPRAPGAGGCVVLSPSSCAASRRAATASPCGSRASSLALHGLPARPELTGCVVHAASGGAAVGCGVQGKERGQSGRRAAPREVPRLLSVGAPAGPSPADEAAGARIQRGPAQRVLPPPSHPQRLCVAGARNQRGLRAGGGPSQPSPEAAAGAGSTQQNTTQHNRTQRPYAAHNVLESASWEPPDASAAVGWSAATCACTPAIADASLRRSPGQAPPPQSWSSPLWGASRRRAAGRRDGCGSKGARRTGKPAGGGACMGRAQRRVGASGAGAGAACAAAHALCCCAHGTHTVAGRARVRARAVQQVAPTAAAAATVLFAPFGPGGMQVEVIGRPARKAATACAARADGFTHWASQGRGPR